MKKNPTFFHHKTLLIHGGVENELETIPNILIKMSFHLVLIINDTEVSSDFFFQDGYLTIFKMVDE